jgi:hypothetical protein
VDGSSTEVLRVSWGKLARFFAFPVALLGLFALRGGGWAIFGGVLLAFVVCVGIPFSTRALMLDAGGIRQLRVLPGLDPKKIIPWSDVERIDTFTTRAGKGVGLWLRTKSSDGWRRGYPHVWLRPTLRGPDGRTLKVDELCGLLESRWAAATGQEPQLRLDKMPTTRTRLGFQRAKRFEELEPEDVKALEQDPGFAAMLKKMGVDAAEFAAQAHRARDESAASRDDDPFRTGRL